MVMRFKKNVLNLGTNYFTCVPLNNIIKKEMNWYEGRMRHKTPVIHSLEKTKCCIILKILKLINRHLI